MPQPPLTRREARRDAARARRAPLAVRLVQGALGAALVSVLGILAGGGTYALWSEAAPVGSDAVLTAGTAELAVSAATLAATELYPGRTVSAATTVRNTGTVPLSLSLTATGADTAFTRALRVSVAPTTAAADCTAGRVPVSGSAAVGTAADLGITLAPGASTMLCIGIGLPATAPAAAAGAASTPLTLSISGAQVLP